MNRAASGGRWASVTLSVATVAAAVGAFALLLGFTPTSAAAQCAEGRVANEQTQGRCCWPGQTWNAETSLCAGVPACPEGRVSQGDDCVLAAGTATATAAVPVAPTGYGAQPPPQTQPQPQPYYQQPGYEQPEPAPTQTVTTINKGLVVTGAIIFGASYLPAVVIGVGEGYGALAVPLAGPFIFMGEVNGSSSGAGYAYMGLTFWGLAQVTGATLLILGLVLKREVEVRADLGNGRSIALTPYEAPAGGGLQLIGEF